MARAASSANGFGRPWLALCVAFALHVLDEATTGFLAVYNPTVTVMRQRWRWFPMPTFEFRGWLIGLILGVALCFALTPLAARGTRGLRPFAWFFAGCAFAECDWPYLGNNFWADSIDSYVPASRSGVLFLPAALYRIDLAHGSLVADLTQ